MSNFKEHVIENVIVIGIAIGLIFAGAYIWTPLAAVGMVIFIIWSLSLGVF